MKSICKLRNHSCQRVLLIGATILTGLTANGATLVLTDGSRLEGKLEKIHDGTVHFTTGFAGTLEIEQGLVAGLESDEAVMLRTATGEVFRGPVRVEESGAVVVDSTAGTVRTGLDTVVAGWKEGDRDPEAVARETELESQVRKWSYRAGVDISGEDGNSEDFATSIQAEAKLEGPHDRLVLYGSYKYKETDSVSSEDEQIGGAKYTNFFTERWGWFMREEIERDVFEGIDFRSTTAGGLVYKFIDQERLYLEGSAGLSYRFEDYTDPALDSEDFPGLDFGLDLSWQFADWGRLVSSVDYIPSIDDFGDYLINHESGVDIPLGTADNWFMRFGLSNEFNSNPEAGREKLDTSYFARLILTWD